MTGAAWEKLISEQCARYRYAGRGAFAKCGVQAARMKSEWIVTRSKPDFEGTLDGGMAIYFDCKVCSQASFPWDKYRPKGSRERQLRYLMERSRFGAVCGFLFHFPERRLKTRTDAELSIWLPVRETDPYWEQVLAGEVCSLDRVTLEAMGQAVPWTKPHGFRKPLPDFLEAVARCDFLEAVASVSQRPVLAG